MTAIPPPRDVAVRWLQELWFFLPRAAWLVRAYPGTVTSWWRDPVKNRAVGGNPASQHLAALAFDYVLDRSSDGPAFVLLASQLDLVAIAERTHVHVQAFRAGTLGL